MSVRPRTHHAFLCAVVTALPLACELSSATAEHDAGPVIPAAAAPTVRGSDDTFEIATWNLEHFPKAGAATIDRLSRMIRTLQLDIIAVQEVADTKAFGDMVADIPRWRSVVAARYDASRVTGKYNPPVGFMYDSSSIKLIDKYLLFVGDTLAFPRSPLALDIEWHGVPLTVIAVHLKALGDDVLDSDPNDEENRRKAACDMLARYLDEHDAGRRVIVLGDFNDRLGEPPATDVFAALDSRPDRFYFVDTDLALHGGAETVSYPPYGSHIDHILITSELFPAFFTTGSDVQTLTVEGFLPNGWFEYDALVSDHRPVYTRLILDTQASPARAGSQTRSPSAAP